MSDPSHEQAIVPAQDGPQHHHPATSWTNPFSDRDVDYFRRQDRSAGRAVVLLMCGIFSMGVVIYSIVLASIYF